MNILIIGGLLGLAVLAILGAVLLGMGEDRAEKARRTQVAAQSREPELSLPQPHPAATNQVPAYQSVPATPLLSRPTVPLAVSGSGEGTGNLDLTDLNGQVREITGELRLLAQRTSELQQRLTMLSDTLEQQDQPHAEPSYNNSSADLFPSDAETQVF